MDEEKRHEKATRANCFGDIRDGHEPYLDSPGSLAELLEKMKGDFGGGRTVWRGQTNMLWPPVPSLYRRLRASGLLDSQISEECVRQVEKRMIEDARSRALVEDRAEIAEFMVRLQHYGGATRLLDVTFDHKIALYFASANEDGTGVVHRYRVSEDCVFDLEGGDQSVIWDEMLNSAQPGHPLLVIPPVLDKRIKTQSSAFITTSLLGTLSEPNLFTHETFDTEVHLFLISPSLKKELRSWLLDQDISEKTLFPSIEEFAHDHSASTPIALLG